VGEIFNSIWDCKQLIEEQLIDYIRATVVQVEVASGLFRDFWSLLSRTVPICSRC